MAVFLGAAITPAVFSFYSSGAVEDKWDANYLTVNRTTATSGITNGWISNTVVTAIVLLSFVLAKGDLPTAD